jgi:CelD/BcsL family acetyltransferase involved in cellulose biosynthesis
LLLHHLIRHCCERGLTVFDLGAGEADYKSHICDGTDALFDLAVPVTAKGQAAAFVQDMAGQLKRRMKQSPRLWPLIVRLRRLRGRLSA